MKTNAFIHAFCVAVAFSFVHVSVGFGQFDLDGFIQGKADQVIGRLEGQIQESIGRHFENRPFPFPEGNPVPPRYEILPYPNPPVEPPIQVGPPQYIPPQYEFPANGSPFPTPGTGAPPQQTIPQYELPNYIPAPTTEYVQPTQPVYPNASQPAAPPKASQPKRKPAPSVNSGDVVNIGGRKYGTTEGKVLLKIDSLWLKVNTLKWTPERVSARLPYLPLEKAAQATVVVVDSNDKIADKALIRLVPAAPPSNTQAAAKKPVVPKVFPGQKLNIRGEFGDSQGKVELRLGGVSMTTNLLSWTKDKVIFEMPGLQLASPQDANVVVVGQQGKELKTVKIQFAPPEQK